MDLRRFRTELYDHLTNNILPFWHARTLDHKHGGYLHRFDREGNVTGTDKLVWCQARQAFLFASLHRQLKLDSKWLDFAEHGRKFLLEKCVNHEGRFYYLVDQAGNPIQKKISILTEVFIFMALAEIQLATGKVRDTEIMLNIYNRALETDQSGQCPESIHFTIPQGHRWQVPSMLLTGIGTLAQQVFDPKKITPEVNAAADRMLYEFSNDQSQCFFEFIQLDGKLPTHPDCRILNPGHAIEASWFCLDWAYRNNDTTRAERAAQVIEWSYKLALDHQYGGLIAYCTPDGTRPPGPEIMNISGEHWDTKIWWVQAESMCGLLLAGLLTSRTHLTQEAINLWKYCQEHFIDQSHGEWFEYLHRHNTIMSAQKSSWVRCAFHIPRCLVKMILALDEHATKTSNEMATTP
ncbi:AGE family epimerase/isomerase [Poriferisphaera sp. WC338]|uniref:AGE family epimerase/isomerase n=1 Tax=Poriferisphaera sp. WC338 TaxID=3425129 RepID=UPI003D814B8F